MRVAAGPGLHLAQRGLEFVAGRRQSLQGFDARVEVNYDCLIYVTQYLIEKCMASFAFPLEDSRLAAAGVHQ